MLCMIVILKVKLKKFLQVSINLTLSNFYFFYRINLYCFKLTLLERKKARNICAH